VGPSPSRCFEELKCTVHAGLTKPCLWLIMKRWGFTGLLLPFPLCHPVICSWLPVHAAWARRPRHVSGC
jgi:hypothetical protein